MLGGTQRHSRRAAPLAIERAEQTLLRVELRLGYSSRLCEQIATINNHETSCHVVCCTAH